MVNTKTLAAIEQSRFREIYEIFADVLQEGGGYND